MRRLVVHRLICLLVPLALGCYTFDLRCAFENCCPDDDCCAECHSPVDRSDRPNLVLEQPLLGRTTPPLPAPNLIAVEAPVAVELMPGLGPSIPAGPVRGPPARSYG